jgi:hypothetical protein
VGIEPTVRVLQTLALPLGDVAIVGKVYTKEARLTRLGLLRYSEITRLATRRCLEKFGR